MSNNSYAFISGFPRAPLRNGVGRVTCQLKRITIKFCKSWGSSQGVRHFIEEDLLDFSKANPEVVVYLKPRRHRTPVIISEYMNGNRFYFNIHNFPRDEVNKWLDVFRTRPGVKTIRYRKLFHTECPSVQGVWSPFTNRDPKMNVTTFPNLEFSTVEESEKSATEKVIEMWEKQKHEEKLSEEFENLDIKVQNEVGK